MTLIILNKQVFRPLQILPVKRWQLQEMLSKLLTWEVWRNNISFTFKWALNSAPMTTIARVPQSESRLDTSKFKKLLLLSLFENEIFPHWRQAWQGNEELEFLSDCYIKHSQGEEWTESTGYGPVTSRLRYL